MTTTRFGTVDTAFVAGLRDIVGDRNVVTERGEMEDYSHDEFPLADIRSYPDAVVKPAGTDQVSAVARLCNVNLVPLTARGGGTGLCGGCVPAFGGVLVSFENLARTLDVDQRNMTATLDAGIRLADLYAAVEANGLFFPPHPGDETAMVGGVVATNAGGSRAVKYGVVRDFVKGVTVVLADGSVVDFGGAFIKNSSGYNIMHLIIGSEGTLGLVTRVTMALVPPPGATITLVVPFDSLHDAIKTVPAIMLRRVLPMAVEFVNREAVELSAGCVGGAWPCRQGTAHLMIMLDASSEAEVLALAEKVSDTCQANGALDVFVADTSARQREVLAIRSGIYEALRPFMIDVLDIAVPRSRIAEFVDSVHAVEEESRMWLPTYGHAADGNVHTHLMHHERHDGAWSETAGWREKYPGVRARLHEIGRSLGGICSGEHGIGLVKKEYLSSFLQPKNISLMKDIKRCFDPNGILNPGKVFD